MTSEKLGFVEARVTSAANAQEKNKALIYIYTRTQEFDFLLLIRMKLHSSSLLQFSQCDPGEDPLSAPLNADADFFF